MTEELTTNTADMSIATDNDDDEGGGNSSAASPATPSATTSSISVATPSSAASTATKQQDETMIILEEEDGIHAGLEKEVRSRDSDISGLDKLRLEKSHELDNLQKELDSERLMQMKESILHRIEVERLKRQTAAVQERFIVLEKDMSNTDAIREYAELIKSVAPKGGNVDSQYVMKLQSQLAKAVKRMDATSHQMTQVEQSCEEVVNSLKKEIGDIVEDRCRTELELRKQLELLEEQKLEIQSEYDDRIQTNQKELERLKGKVTVEITTIADLEEELEETEGKLEKLNNVHEMQERTIEALNVTLKTNGVVGDTSIDEDEDDVGVDDENNSED
jgi:DNA repair exonuclease SbcCD ATPase subunit